MQQGWDQDRLEEHHKLRRNALPQRLGLYNMWAPMPADMQELPSGPTLPTEVSARVSMQARPRLAQRSLRSTQRVPCGLVMGQLFGQQTPPHPTPTLPPPRPVHHLELCPLDCKLDSITSCANTYPAYGFDLERKLTH